LQHSPGHKPASGCKLTCESSLRRIHSGTTSRNVSRGPRSSDESIEKRALRSARGQRVHRGQEVMAVNELISLARLGRRMGGKAFAFRWLSRSKVARGCASPCEAQPRWIGKPESNGKAKPFRTSGG